MHSWLGYVGIMVQKILDVWDLPWTSVVVADCFPHWSTSHAFEAVKDWKCWSSRSCPSICYTTSVQMVFTMASS